MHDNLCWLAGICTQIGNNKLKFAGLGNIIKKTRIFTVRQLEPSHSNKSRVNKSQGYFKNKG